MACLMKYFGGATGGRKASFGMTFHIMTLFGPKRMEGDLNDKLIYPYSACPMLEKQFPAMVCLIKCFGGAAVGENLISA